MKIFSALISCLLAFSLNAEEMCPSILQTCGACPDLLRDLAIIETCDERDRQKLPVHYGFYGHVGYFAMPSARMGAEGTAVAGFSKVDPYRNYFLGFQLFQRLEFSGVYRVFRGFLDPTLGPRGFGDFSDKGINFKASLILPEDTDYLLPGIAFGAEDLIGTRRFGSLYLVATQVFPNIGLEASLGYGFRRIHGIFGGASWMPWWKSCNPILSNLCFAVEYDKTNYERDPHPKRIIQKHAFNYGVKLLLGRYGNVFASYIRGNQFAFGVALACDIGRTKGFVPKIGDPLPYQSPINWQPLCILRKKQDLADELSYAFYEQGFVLMQALLKESPNGYDILRIEVVNNTWRYEREVHRRLSHLMAFLTPSNVEKVVVVVRSSDMPIQEYRFRSDDIGRFAGGCMCESELQVLSPLREATCPTQCPRPFFERAEKAIEYDLRPRFRSFFGSSSGKFKCGGDIVGSLDGYFASFLYYRAQLRYTVFSQMETIGDFDLLNPSQLLNVNSDRIRYFQTARLFLEQAYLQRCWSAGCGLYGRAAVGLFDVAYGGFAYEALYYPVNSQWAIGFEAGILKKRTYNGTGFMSKIRKMDGPIAEFLPYNFLGQYFVDFYYDFRPIQVELRLSAGQFLARDVGVKTELTRYFDNGFKVSVWYTVTNGHDHVNGSVYYDQGISISMPMDFFYKCSSKSRWFYGMSAWLRDVGYRSPVGRSLFQVIHDERQ